jgi:hypothetical protein
MIRVNTITTPSRYNGRMSRHDFILQLAMRYENNDNKTSNYLANLLHRKFFVEAGYSEVLVVPIPQSIVKPVLYGCKDL